MAGNYMDGATPSGAIPAGLTPPRKHDPRRFAETPLDVGGEGLLTFDEHYPPVPCARCRSHVYRGRFMQARLGDGWYGYVHADGCNPTRVENVRAISSDTLIYEREYGGRYDQT